MDSEVYGIDLNPKRNMLIHGGGDDKCIVTDLETGDIISVVEDFDDSVIFCKFIDEERFIVASLDGTISLMTLEGEINNVSVNEDISRIKINGDKLVVGTVGGNVHLFTLDLCIQNVCIGQYNEIQDICYEDGKVYTLSETNFVIFDAKSHQKLMDVHVRGGSAMDKIPSSDVVCLGLEGCIVVRKNAHLLSRISVEGTPECVLYMNNYFIVGGDFDHILLINMPMGMRTFKIPIGAEKILSIKGDGENRIVFSTCNGIVGCGDIRDEKSFKLVEGGVGCIFDLCFKNSMVYIGGEHGFNALDMRSIEELKVE
ncbi:WD40 domain-containing protein [Encephalitozoon hellem]|uniref:WD40 domain-containing protein n=1 Tax=Encephalitozoon hellem TaxID=27973 RepID=A0ABY8CIB5_ENCHE|nr:WD40 domain-containing protein [Encephalitozoon hellem]